MDVVGEAQLWIACCSKTALCGMTSYDNQRTNNETEALLAKMEQW